MGLLQSRPGNWASLGVFPRAKTEGPQTTLRRKGCTVTIRQTADGFAEVWALWPPDKQTAMTRRAAPVDGVTWGTPSKLRTGRKAKFDYDEMVARARTRTGRWVTLGVFDAKEGVAAYHALRRRGCRVRTTRNDDGTVTLSGRVLP